MNPFTSAPANVPVGALRTPDERFANLPAFPFSPHYLYVDGLRMHYLDEGPSGADPILLLHGEPSWCYLYRHMIPPLVQAGYHLVAPDLIGFGRSDKLTSQSDYSYQFHVDTINQFVNALDLKRVTLFGQDWGGLIGLRVLADNPHRFTHVVVANTGLPTGDQPPSAGFLRWLEYSQSVENFHVGGIVKGGCKHELSAETIAAYNAPFPGDEYKAAARAFPRLVPIRPDDPASEANRQAWQALEKWPGKILTLFSDGDPVTVGGERPFQRLAGAQGQPHATICGAGHFLQEDASQELTRNIMAWKP